MGTRESFQSVSDLWDWGLSEVTLANTYARSSNGISQQHIPMRAFLTIAENGKRFKRF